MNAETAGHDAAAGARTLAGKYMTFKISNEEYGLGILKVRELIGLLKITRVPQTPPWVSGVINLRGKVIPVVDLRLKFNMSPSVATEQTVIIVVQLVSAAGTLIMGVLVDEVLEVLDILAVQIEPPPSFGTQSTDASFILGVGKSGERVIFLLDIDAVLHAEDAGLLGRSEGTR